MTEKRFILKADYDWWGVLDTTGEIKGEYDDCFSTDEVVDLLNAFYEENKSLKGSLYAEKTNTAEVINEYSKQFKRHSKEFSFMIDLAEDLGVDVKGLEALDD